MSLVSLYDEASLWMTPSGAKDGKLFSELPTDGSGDFTFSRGSNLAATRVGPTGLIEKGRENLFLNSNQFDTGWPTSNATFTSGQSGYDGSSDAWLLTSSVAGGRIQLTRSDTGVHTTSAYFKKGSADGVWFRINMGADANIYVNLINGTKINSTGEIATKITDVGNGWYRVELTANWVSVDDVRIYPANTSGVSIAGSIYIQDAQLEIGLAATDYIESGATTGKAGLLENEPRLDYSGGATCPSLLLEPQRTNKVLYSEGYVGFQTSTSGTGITPVITQNAAISPDGTQNAFRVDLDRGAGNTSGDFSWIYQSGIVYAGENQISVYLKAATSNDIGKEVSLRASGGSQTLTLTADWKRHTMSRTSSSTSDVGLYSRGGQNADNAVSCYVYGWQVENNSSYPTSYIPTYGTSQTRSVDGGNNFQIDNLKNNGFFGNTYTLFYEFDNLNFGASSQQFNYLFDDNGSLAMYVYGTTLTILTESGPRYTLFTNGFTNVKSGKFLVKYDGSDIKIFKDGSLYQTYSDPTSSWSIPKFIRLYTSSATASISYKQVLTFPTALNDSECIALTKLG